MGVQHFHFSQFSCKKQYTSHQSKPIQMERLSTFNTCFFSKSFYFTKSKLWYYDTYLHKTRYSIPTFLNTWRPWRPPPCLKSSWISKNQGQHWQIKFESPPLVSADSNKNPTYIGFGIKYVNKSEKDGQTKLWTLRLRWCNAKEHDFAHQPKQVDDKLPTVNICNWQWTGRGQGGL